MSIVARPMLTGGCLCGAVRYRIAADPVEPAWCHCRLCQLASGAPAMAFATVPLAGYAIDQGTDVIGEHVSSAFGRRRFCTHCGTPLSMTVDHEPDTIDFTLATLDDPAAVPPAFHIFYASRIAWADAGDALPRHDGDGPALGNA